jgi:TonB family protein
MKTWLLIIFVTTFATLPRVPAAPRPQGGAGHFSKEGLSFDYPEGWKLDDGSNAELQRLMLTRVGASNIVMVFAQREPITTAAQLFASRNSVTMPYVENIARRLGLKEPPASPESQCVEVSGRSAVGFRMAGQLEKEPTTAEVYTVVLGQRLIHLVHIRADKDEAAGAAAWKAVLDTLKVEPPASPSPEAERIDKIVMGGVLNGKALKKPLPEYPLLAKRSRISGTVAVQITVDEHGDVISARAISGHPMLHGASVEAAKRAKFTPTTLCGTPVQVTGVVTYNFYLR